MSHFTAVATRLTDPQILAASLSELGFHPIVHSQPIPLNGYDGSSQGQSAEIVVAAQQLAKRADLGFALQADGTYRLIWDDWEAARAYIPGTSIPLTELPSRLQVLYSKNLALAIAQRQGHTVASVTQRSDGGYTVRVLPGARRSTQVHQIRS